MSQEEEQLGELEALEAIYASELGIFNPHYPNIKFRIHVRSEQAELGEAGTSCDANEAAEEAEDSEDEEDSPVDQPLRCTLVVSLPSGYPEEAPGLRLRGLVRRLGPKTKEDILRRLQEVAQENLGMQSTFTIISELQERLGELSCALVSDAAAKAEAKRVAEEEAEDAKFRGTIVTQESFLQWRVHFNEDMGIAKRAREEAAAKAKRRPTGKEQFLRDATLNLSDIQLIQEAAEAPVEVDESLFEDLDDLDIDE